MALVERDAEIAAVTELLTAAADGHGGVLLAEGPPGIGKTALLACVRELATARGFRVLTAIGGELDQELPFAIVRQLLGAPLLTAPPGTRADLLAGAAGLAAPVFGLGDDTSVRDVPAIGNVVHGLYWLCSNLADDAPLMLAVDDIHWADDASLRFLSHMTRRADDLPVLIVVAGRGGTWFDGFVGRVLGGVSAEHLRLRPLSPSGVGLVVRQAMSPDADEKFCEACARASGGNPFLLAEALAALRADGVRPVAGEAKRVESLRPETIARAVLPRIARLGPEAVRFVRALAVLGSAAGLRQIARQADLAVPVAAGLADALAREAIITARRPLEFAHPLIRSAVYADSSELVRAAEHKRAAHGLAQDGAAAEQLAPHLLAAEQESDPWVVDTLRAAALSALARGAPESAAAFLQRALTEPPAPDKRGPLHAEFGRVLGMANRPDEAAAALRQAIEAAGQPQERVRLATELSTLMTLAGRSRDAAQALDIARLEVDRNQEDLPVPSYVALALSDMTVRKPASAWLARLDRLVPQLSPDRDPDRMLLAVLAFGAAGAGDRPADEVARLASLAAAGPLPPHDGFMLVNLAGSALAMADRFPESLELLDRGIDATRQLGDVAWYAYLTVLRSHAALFAGRVREAEGDARAAMEIQEETGNQDASLAAAVLVEALAHRGSLGEAQQVLAASGLEGEHQFDTLITHFVLMARGQLRSQQNRMGEALADFRHCGEILACHGYTNPSFAPWRAEAARAQLALGEASAATKLAAEDLELARAFGAPRAIAAALRTLGLVQGGEPGLALLAEAVETLSGQSCDLELGQALVDHGRALRQAGQRKRACDELREGLNRAVNCGAEALADAALSELRAAGARPRRRRLTGRDALTASELRIAELAANGATNREIAQALFLSQRTIEVHLTSTYRKLGISSRNDLRSSLAEPVI